MTNLTPSQQAALDGTGGIFIPFIENEGDTPWVSFRTPEGRVLPFHLFAAWSSVTPGLPTIQIDSEGTNIYDADEFTPEGTPRLRIWLNDEVLHGEEFR